MSGRVRVILAVGLLGVMGAVLLGAYWASPRKVRLDEGVVDKVAKGMSVEEVVGILGKARDVSAGVATVKGVKKSLEFQTWVDGGRKVIVTFEGGKVVQVMRVEAVRK